MPQCVIDVFLLGTGGGGTPSRPPGRSLWAIPHRGWGAGEIGWHGPCTSMARAMPEPSEQAQVGMGNAWAMHLACQAKHSMHLACQGSKPKHVVAGGHAQDRGHSGQAQAVNER